MTNNKQVITKLAALMAVIGLAVACIILAGFALIFGYFATIFPELAVWRSPAPPPLTAPMQQQTINLVGIWQDSAHMAAGWSDRYHFYPSGAFHFYPNQMTCPEQKVELAGTWALRGSQLTLTVARQVVNTYQQSTGGFCILQDSREEDLSTPLSQVFTIGARDMTPDDTYPSITLSDVPYWQFSADPASYGSETFPE